MNEKDIEELAESVGTLVQRILKLVLSKQEKDDLDNKGDDDDKDKKDDSG